MRSSPRRPLILKRRKLNLTQKDGARSVAAPEQRLASVTRDTEQHGHSATQSADVACGHNPTVTATPETSLTSRAAVSSPPERSPFSESIICPDESQTSSLGIPASCAAPSTGITADTIKVMGHPTIPDTQLVVIPPHSDVESIIHALTVRGREGGGPNKFILISGSPSFLTQAEKLGFQSKEEEVVTLKIEAPSSSQDTEEDEVKVEGEDLNISLTNMQWLGDMATDSLGTCDAISGPAKEESLTPEADSVKVEKEPAEPACTQQWPPAISERPPYSYMALIQFAINSTANKRMTLKDIYTWIEEHFPYFRYVAKPGWKNSIRHNLSLHDMFVRESLSNNKISYWTIHPQANRCLTLDQVYKAGGSATSVCSEPKLPIPDLSRRVQATVTKAPERKMKPLLPRIDSYFVPVQFPVTQQVLFSPVEAFCADPVSSEAMHSTKRVKIAPKVLMETEESPPVVEEMEVKADRESAETKSTTPFLCRRASGSRRKQQLSTPRCPVPELVLPDCSAADSGLDTDFSFLQDTQAHEGPCQITQDEVPCQITQDEVPCQITQDEGPCQITQDEGPCQITQGEDFCRFTQDEGPCRITQDESSCWIMKDEGPCWLTQDEGLCRITQDEGLCRITQDEGLCRITQDEGPFRITQDEGPFRITQDEGPCQITQDEDPSENTQDEDYTFKTPIKERLKPHASSTPSKPPDSCTLPPWDFESPLTRYLLPDLSPVRIPCSTALTPFKDRYGTLNFGETPFKDLPFFGSPLDLIGTFSPASPQSDTLDTPKRVRKQRCCSKELQVGGTTSRSLLEGLVLDTKDESLSKILLDISFSGMEEDNIMGGDSSYLGQLLS